MVNYRTVFNKALEKLGETSDAKEVLNGMVRVMLLINEGAAEDKIISEYIAWAGVDKITP